MRFKWVSLNELGIKQARYLADKLFNLDVCKIYSSDLLRAKQTTLEINKKLNVDIIYSLLLRETNYGLLEGEMSKITDSNLESEIFFTQALLHINLATVIIPSSDTSTMPLMRAFTGIF